MNDIKFKSIVGIYIINTILSSDSMNYFQTNSHGSHRLDMIRTQFLSILCLIFQKLCNKMDIYQILVFCDKSLSGLP